MNKPKTKMKSFKKPPQCQHIKTNGLQCGSPALREKRFCFFHQRTRELHHLRKKRPEMKLYIPLLEDANAVQIAIQQVAGAIVEERIDPKRAGLLLFAFQTAACNLKHTDFEPQKLREEMGELSEPLNPFIESLARELGLTLPGMEEDDDDFSELAPEPPHAAGSEDAAKRPPAPAPSPEFPRSITGRITNREVLRLALPREARLAALRMTIQLRDCHSERSEESAVGGRLWVEQSLP